MTRKHYKLLAESIRSVYNRAEEEADLGVCEWLEEMTRSIASALASDNDRFDRERFLAAALKESA